MPESQASRRGTGRNPDAQTLAFAREGGRSDTLGKESGTAPYALHSTRARLSSRFRNYEDRTAIRLPSLLGQSAIRPRCGVALAGLAAWTPHLPGFPPRHLPERTRVVNRTRDGRACVAAIGAGAETTHRVAHRRSSADTRGRVGPAMTGERPYPAATHGEKDVLHPQHAPRPTVN